MFRPHHPPRIYNSNYTWRRVQIMKLLFMQFSPPSRHSIPLSSKYSPQHPVLKHPQFYVPLLLSEIIDQIPAELYQLSSYLNERK
jgi:hypothetical protein